MDTCVFQVTLGQEPRYSHRKGRFGSYKPILYLEIFRLKMPYNTIRYDTEIALKNGLFHVTLENWVYFQIYLENQKR